MIHEKKGIRSPGNKGMEMEMEARKSDEEKLILVYKEEKKDKMMGKKEKDKETRRVQQSRESTKVRRNNRKTIKLSRKIGEKMDERKKILA